MATPTEQIGSIPRPPQLLESIKSFKTGGITAEALERLYEEALCETILRLEQTDSPVITDGEQTKPSFATYPLTGLQNLAPDGVVIPFADGHQRQLPRLTSGPFRYAIHADGYTKAALGYTKRRVKQAVISAFALSLLYPGDSLPGYSREEFISDLVDEAEADIRCALDAGAMKPLGVSARTSSALAIAPFMPLRPGVNRISAPNAKSSTHLSRLEVSGMVTIRR